MEYSTTAAPSIGVSDFALRYAPDSRHCHFEGTWDELIRLIRDNWERKRVSPHNPKVVRVPMHREITHRFYATTVPVTSDTRLKAEFAPRREGELPYIQISAEGGRKYPAQSAEVILYALEVLGETPPGPLAEYYIVAIKAYPTLEPEPMDPMTMARNLLELEGGTKPPVPYTAEEFAQAILFWNTHTSIS